MPIARCATCGPPSRKGNAYGRAVEPLGYPHCGIICGVPGCENPALIWLTAWEAAEFQKGRRIFNLSGRSPKVRLADSMRALRSERLGAGPLDIADRDGSMGPASALI